MRDIERDREEERKRKKGRQTERYRDRERQRHRQAATETDADRDRDTKKCLNYIFCIAPREYSSPNRFALHILLTRGRTISL